MGRCIFMVGAIACDLESVPMSQYCEIHQNEGPPESTITPEEYPRHPDQEEPTDEPEDESDPRSNQE
jgi:hypothetical protein